VGRKLAAESLQVQAVDVEKQNERVPSLAGAARRACAEPTQPGLGRGKAYNVTANFRGGRSVCSCRSQLVTPLASYGSSVTVTGSELLVRVPSPSWPSSFRFARQRASVISYPADVWDNTRVKDSFDEKHQRVSDKRAPSCSGAVATVETAPVSVAGVEAKFANKSGSQAEVLESVHLLDGGGQSYPRMLLAIAQAKRTIHLEVYSFAPSGVGARFVEALGEAAKRGVAVQVVIDGWGTARSGRAVAGALRNVGCTVQIYGRLLSLFIGHFGRNHRKILLVDDRVAFIGGINIGDENVGEGLRLGWADLALEIRGTHSARLGEMIRHEPEQSVDSSLRIHLCGLGRGWRLRRLYLKAFANARQRIHLAHGYFLPDRGVVRAITAAARRGVQVRLLLAGRSDVPFIRAATRSLYRQLLAVGVTIHEWNDSILHAKVATIDGCCLLVGSFNLDPFSLSNLEVLVEVADPAVVDQGEAWIQDHFARARSITSLETSWWLQRWLLDPFGHLVARVTDMFSRVTVSRKRRQHGNTGRRSR